MPPIALTGREHTVLRAVGRGLSDAEIAAVLAVSEADVAEHLARIRDKLGLRDRAAAIVYAFDHGIVTPGEGPFVANPRETPRITSTTPSEQARLRISVLGPLRAWARADPLDLGPVRQQALLAALVLRPDVPVSRQELLEGVWGPAPPSANVVQVYVYRLRKKLPPGADAVIARDRSGYRFRGAGVDLDTTRLERLAAEAASAGQAGDVAAAVATQARALDLFYGEPLAGLPGPFAEMERLRLAERRMTMAEQKVEWQLRLGRHTDAIDELRALAPAHPHNEQIATLLMRALHASGRRADALAVFAQLRRRLRKDLGVEPGDRPRLVLQALLRGETPGLGARQPAWQRPLAAAGLPLN